MRVVVARHHVVHEGNEAASSIAGYVSASRPGATRDGSLTFGQPLLAGVSGRGCAAGAAITCETKALAAGMAGGLDVAIDRIG
jgi:hypothetical protein